MSFERCAINRDILNIDKVTPPVINCDMYEKDGDMNVFVKRLDTLITDSKNAIDHYATLYSTYKDLAKADEKHVGMLGTAISYIAEKENTTFGEAYSMIKEKANIKEIEK